MKVKLIISVLFFISFVSFSQNKVTGVVLDIKGQPLRSISVSEIGTDNQVWTDEDGKFILNTFNDTCEIFFLWIDMQSRTIEISNDTSVYIILQYRNYNDTKWFTIGANYEVLNSKYGLTISNGYDEHPLIHFEDFQESLLFKLAGSTDFENDYSFNVKLGLDYLLRHFYMTTLEYKILEYESNNFSHTDINLSTGFRFNRLPGTILFKTGYQSLNGENNFGAGIGWQNNNRKPDLYYGIKAGYWGDYFTYKVYIQSFVYKHRISLRADYERIGSYDFVNVGVNFSFNR